MTMSITLSGVLGAAIFEASHGERPQSAPGMARAVDLLARITGGSAVVLVRAADDRLIIDGEQVPAGAPGADLVLAMMARHGVFEIRLPAGLFVPQWESVTALLATPPELWTSADGMMEAMRQAVPGVTLVHRPDGTPGAGENGADAATTAGHTDSANGSGMDELRALVRRAGQAIAAGDWESLDAEVMGLEQFTAGAGKHVRPIIVDEWNRLFTPSLLADLVREMSLGGAATAAGRVLIRTGEPGISAVIERLGTGPVRSARRACMDWLVANPAATPALFHALSQPGTTLLRDVAEVVGRRGSDGAVGLLTPLLSHTNEEVRAAAWRALEDIGTPEAIAALRPR